MTFWFVLVATPVRLVLRLQQFPSMKEQKVTIPEIVLFGGTRVALGIGIGLLIANSLSRDQRKGAGWALLAVGALTTIPFAVTVASRRRDGPPELAS